MKIFIVANFTNSETSRFFELARLFTSRRHDVVVITSDFSHSSKRLKKEKPQYDTFKTVYLHEPGYKSNVSIKRLWSHYVWGRNVEKYIQNSTVKPDVVYASLPTYTAGRLVGKWCNKNDVKYIVDVQDLWPEAFKVAVKNSFLQQAFLPMEWIANAAYKTADYVIGVSDTYRNRTLKVNKKCKEGLTVFLGNNGEKFDIAKEKYRICKPDDEFWIAYIGTMGFSYDINLAIDAIKLVKVSKLSKKVKFVAMGNGPLLDEYKKHAEESDIDFEFTGSLPYEIMVGKLCSCDAVINCLRPGAAQSITNKVGDYALSGLPVINTQENPEYRKLVEATQCGISCECGNAEDVAAAIVKLVESPELRKQMGEAARQLGKDKFDRRCSYARIVEAVEKLGNTQK